MSISLDTPALIHLPQTAPQVTKTVRFSDIVVVIQNLNLGATQRPTAHTNTERLQPRCCRCPENCSTYVTISVISALAVVAIGAAIYGLWTSMAGGTSN